MNSSARLSTDACLNFFRSATEGLALVNQSGKIEFVNQAFARIFGYEESEMYGMSVDSLVPSSHRGKHHQYRSGYHQKPVKRRMGTNRDLEGIRKDGSIVPVEISLSPIEDEGEAKVAVLVSDITERIQLQRELKALNDELQERVDLRTEELQASQELYKLIAQNFPGGTISVFDQELRYIFVEGQELKQLGVTSEQLRGTAFLQRLPADIRQPVEENLRRVFEGHTRTFEVALDDQTYAFTSVPLQGGNDEVDRILVVERNVTSERKVEAQLRENLQRERELNELKSRFVSMASHEFRTPLTTISSSASLILRYAETDQQPKRAKHVDRIMNSVQHLTSVLNDILSLSKLEEGHISANYSEFSLRAFVQELQEQMEVVAAGKVTLNVELNRPDAQFCSDLNLMRNIFINLIANAIKYSHKDGEVEVSVVIENDMLVASVSDSGIGIPEAEQKNLFERFFRASNVSNIEGTGLGLNIVGRLLRVLNGEISFTSAQDKGTVFTIKIPNHG